MAIDLLHPNDYNVNVVSPENDSKIEASLKRFGFFKPVLVRKTDQGFEIVGGEHRWAAAKRMGHKEVPIINLGPISAKQAKEISLVDNGRYGSDDMLQLAQLLEQIGADTAELAAFMPYTEGDLSAIFSSVSIDLDDLDLPEDDAASAALPREKPIQTHQIMRFKVGVEDAQRLTELINATMKSQRLTEADALTNAGDALVHLLLPREAE